MHEGTSRAVTDVNAARLRICRAIAEYRSADDDPLHVCAGYELTISERESEWQGWLWCTDQSGKSGWVPELYIERRGETGVMLCDYDATELSVRAGEELLAGVEESGWVWCTNREGLSGWVPAEMLSSKTAKRRP